MAILHLRLDVDSDVHPELHAILSSIGRSGSRSERLRQLASSGLIWEHLRVRAPLYPQVGMTADMDTIVSEGRAEPMTLAEAAPAAVEEAGDDKAKHPARHRALPPRNLPILSDAVDLGAVAERNRISVAQAATNRLPAKQTKEGVPNVAEDAFPVPADPASPPAHKAGPRPRLMRMKEKGLFNNG